MIESAKKILIELDEERRKTVPLAEGELFQTIAAFQLVGYFIWNEEDVSADEAKLVSIQTETSAFESHLLYIGSVRLMVRTQDFHSWNMGSPAIGGTIQITLVRWCND